MSKVNLAVVRHFICVYRLRTNTPNVNVFSLSSESSDVLELRDEFQQAL